MKSKTQSIATPKVRTVNDRSKNQTLTYNLAGNIFMAAPSLENTKKPKKRPKSRVNTRANRTDTQKKQSSGLDPHPKRPPCQTFYNNSSQNQTVNINIYMDPEKLSMLTGPRSVDAFSGK